MNRTSYACRPNVSSDVDERMMPPVIRAFVEVPVRYALVLTALTLTLVAGPAAQTQVPRPAPYFHEFLTPPEQVVAVRAARLFDTKTGAILSNQIVLIRGDRIADVGSSVVVPSGATVIDLGSATLLPGLIDAHVHTYGPGSDPHERAITAVANAQKDLRAGFTTVMDMDSRGGYGTVDLRNAINAGVIDGRGMQVGGRTINQRASGGEGAALTSVGERLTGGQHLELPR